MSVRAEHWWPRAAFCRGLLRSLSRYPLHPCPGAGPYRALCAACAPAWCGLRSLMITSYGRLSSEPLWRQRPVDGKCILFGEGAVASWAAVPAGRTPVYLDARAQFAADCLRPGSGQNGLGALGPRLACASLPSCALRDGAGPYRPRLGCRPGQGTSASPSRELPHPVRILSRLDYVSTGTEPITPQISSTYSRPCGKGTGRIC